MRRITISCLIFFTAVLTSYLFAEEARLFNEDKGEARKIENGVWVQLEYQLNLNDGTVVDQSKEGQPFEYVHGEGQIVPGLERQLEGLQKGDERDLVVPPEEGYGQLNPDAVREIQKNQLAPDVEPQVGMQLRGADAQGNPISAVIKEVKGDILVVDFNHPLAGQILRFHIKILDVQKAKNP